MIFKRFDAFKENFIIAEDNGKIIGFINGCTTDLPELPDELYHNVQLHKKHGDYQTIFGLDVLPDYRRNGVAAQLMNYFIELSKERGKRGWFLHARFTLYIIMKNLVLSIKVFQRQNMVELYGMIWFLFFNSY